MKTVGFFYTPNQQDEHRLALKAMYRGVSKYENCFIEYDCELKECDIAVSWGIYKKKFKWTKIRDILAVEQKLKNKKTIVIEKGYIKRDKYFSVGYDSQNGWADFKNVGMPKDRWGALGVELKDYRTKGNHILICGQVPWDTSVQHIDYKTWCQFIVNEIRRYSERPIIFRPHPLAGDNFYESLTGVTISNKKTLKEDLENCWAAVGYNSNSLVEVIIEGIPIFAWNNGSMAWFVSNKIVDLEHPELYDRQQWAYDLAYSQWTLNEMQEGKAWQHLK